MGVLSTMYVLNFYATPVSVPIMNSQVSYLSEHLNRPLPSSKNPHFRNEATYTTFLVKMSFICMRMKNDFHIKG